MCVFLLFFVFCSALVLCFGVFLLFGFVLLLVDCASGSYPFSWMCWVIFVWPDCLVRWMFLCVWTFFFLFFPPGVRSFLCCVHQYVSLLHFSMLCNWIWFGCEDFCFFLVSGVLVLAGLVLRP